MSPTIITRPRPLVWDCFRDCHNHMKILTKKCRPQLNISNDHYHSHHNTLLHSQMDLHACRLHTRLLMHTTPGLAIEFLVAKQYVLSRWLKKISLWRSLYSFTCGNIQCSPSYTGAKKGCFFSSESWRTLDVPLGHDVVEKLLKPSRSYRPYDRTVSSKNLAQWRTGFREICGMYADWKR